MNDLINNLVKSEAGDFSSIKILPMFAQ